MSSLPRSAEVYAAEQRTEIGAAASAVGRLWDRVGDEFDAGYSQIEPQLLAVLDTAQARVAQGAMDYVPRLLHDTGQGALDRPSFGFDPLSFVGTAGDGMPTDSLAYGSVLRAKHTIAEGGTTLEALAAGRTFLTTAVGTLLSDTGRGVETLATAARPITGYARMLSPPSCGRCVVLAGKRYKTNEGFQRHPGCDCRHIPATEDVAGDLTTDVSAYLGSLDDKSLARTLGSEANAEAFRLGADPGQIVNAYRRGSLRTAQVFDKRIKYTTEGTTRRGWAHHRFRSADRRAPRMMPETILAQAKTKEQALEMLRHYGWAV